MSSTIQDLTGKKFTLDLGDNITGEYIKKQIREKMPSFTGRLIFAGREIEDDKIYNMNDQIINVANRFRGG